MRRQEWLRPSLWFLWSFFVLFVGLLLCYVHSIRAVNQEMEKELFRTVTVAVVGSADLAINNEARYIRHVSLADVSTAFQDCPGCLDYFPGSLSTNPPEYFGIVTRFEQVEP